MANRLDQAASVAVILAALVVSVSFVKRGMAPSRTPEASDSLIEDWESIIPAGVSVGASTAPMKLIEFTDYECPFCAQYFDPLVKLKEEFGDQLQITFVHAPLPQHRFAIPAARVAECALAQDRFMQMQGSLYAKQDSFGLRSWTLYARDAGIPDVPTFSACVADTAAVARIEAGRAHSTRLRIPGTPTFVVNGRMLTGGGPDSLRSLIVSELEKRAKAQ
jgi:protein-disulfide isomerase